MPEDPTKTETVREELPWFPEKAFKLERTRLQPESVRELLLKLMFTRGALRGLELARVLCVPFSLLEPELLELKRQRLCAVVGGAGVGGYDGMDWALSDAGRARAAEVAAARPYVGPAPVDLEEYVKSVEQQHLGRLRVSPARLQQALSGLVLGEEIVDRLGAALASGGPLLLHGSPGNGKTAVAERLARLLRQGIFVPHAIDVDGQVIRLFDSRVHREVPPDDEEHRGIYEGIRSKVDDRWVYVYRPFVVAGGELDLSMLDLVFQESVRTYEAPFQLRANCGLLLVDDLGRQLTEPRQFLNRWIYPLEQGMDHLTLATGKKIRVPFRQLLVFSTNLEPVALADEAFWRRIRHKVLLPDPDAAQYRRIFEEACDAVGLDFDDPAFVHLIKRCYADSERPRRACHPRDLVQHMLDHAEYRDMKPRMTEELVDRACDTYFVD